MTRTPEEIAEMCLNALIGYSTTMGNIAGRHPDRKSRANDPNSWTPAGDVGESFLVILAAVREAWAAGAAEEKS